MHKSSLKHYHLPSKSSMPTASTATTKTSSQSQLPLSINTKTHTATRECILFPTYAFRDPTSKVFYTDQYKYRNNNISGFRY